MKKDLYSPESGERGIVAILMAVAMVGMIGVASLAIDIGSALVAKAELQNVSDAAALAGARELALYYKDNPDRISLPLGGGMSIVSSTAQTYAALNKAGGVSISVPEDDLLFGKYDPKTGAITETSTAVRLVQVTSRRDDTANGVLPTRLATVLGINNMSVRATTAAALTPIGTLKAGQGDFPIGISKDWFNSHKCGDNDKIVLFPTSESSCAGWHTFTSTPASASRLGTILKGMEAGTFESPETIAGETYYNFIGGTVESRCSDLKSLFDAKQVDGVMTARIPVYDFDCGNPNQSRLILGFVETEILQVVCGSAKERKLDVRVKCGIVGDTVGTGGGPADYGFLAESPSMIY